MQLDGTLDMTQYNDAYVQVIDALTLNGTVELGGNSNLPHLYFGYQNDAFGMTVAGTGTIRFGQADTRTTSTTSARARLPLDQSITIQGGHNSSILFYNIGPPGPSTTRAPSSKTPTAVN